MQSKSLSFEQLSDVYAFRILVDDIPGCYAALGIVHTRWRVVPGRFKDYISTPKQNDYQSIHTTIVGPSRQRIGLQIRTKRMHEIAEYGIAAHSLYKDKEATNGETTRSPRSNAYAMLRRTIEALAEGDNPEEFLEHTKLELFQDQVFTFTPKGQLITLPRGAALSTSPMRCTPISAIPASARRSTAASCRSSRASTTATRWRSFVPAFRCRRRPGKRSSSPARRAPPSAGLPAPPCANNIPASATAFWSAPSSAPASCSPAMA